MARLLAAKAITILAHARIHILIAHSGGLIGKMSFVKRAEKAEAQAREYAVQRKKEQERAAADEALRRDMRRTIEIVEKMTDSMYRCTTR